MGPTSWNALKLLLAAGTPIQKLVSGNGKTHLFCNQQALLILNNDGKNAYARFLNKYLGIINRGVMWADKGWKNFSHYFDPVEGLGWGPWPDARMECQFFFENALSYWRNGIIKKSLFYLGAAAHLVQDLCVPHHARGVAFNGHQEYESWVQNNYSHFCVKSNGVYNEASNPAEYIEANAKISRTYFPYVINDNSITSYKMATETLLPLAQRTTAGFFYFF